MTTPITSEISSSSVATITADVQQRINCDLRLITCVGLICSIALAILFAATSQHVFAYLSVAGAGMIFRSYQEIQTAFTPPESTSNEPQNLFKLTQIKIGELVTFVGESVAAAGQYLTGR